MLIFFQALKFKFIDTVHLWKRQKPTKMWMKSGSILFLLIGAVAEGAILRSNRGVLCGAQLSEALSLACGSNFYVPRQMRDLSSRISRPESPSTGLEKGACPFHPNYNGIKKFKFLKQWYAEKLGGSVLLRTSVQQRNSGRMLSQIVFYARTAQLLWPLKTMIHLVPLICFCSQ
ncbi:hypothetical protein CDAR_501051 [Caerostris darwini]|uniref:Uncharacterized protein n=1 Tax=Caerostris darwini TaxID=1538125 RepID=A0AAV4PM00_9ARAC|nr:hypothetical protein CDAR_501051 [Caerostris darwini]